MHTADVSAHLTNSLLMAAEAVRSELGRELTGGNCCRQAQIARLLYIQVAKPGDSNPNISYLILGFEKGQEPVLGARCDLIAALFGNQEAA